MKNKKMIIILTMIVLIIIILLVVILRAINIKKNNNSKESLEVPPPIESYPIINNKLHKLTIQSYSKTVNVCVNQFFKYYSGIYVPQATTNLITYNKEDEIGRIRDNNIDAVYSILDKSYIEFVGITRNNISQKLKILPKVEVEVNEDINVAQKDEKISVYFVTGKLKNTENSKSTDFNIIVCLDMKNRNYSVFLEDYIKKYYPNLNMGEEVDFANFPDEIDNKKYNSFELQIGM